MRVTIGVILVFTACMLCGCALIGEKSRSLAIDFQEPSIAGVKLGDPEGVVVERLGYPYEIRYGRADSRKEQWRYYGLGIEVVLDKQSREVDKVVTFFNRYEGYRPFRGSIVQGFPVASRLVDVKPGLEGYEEIETKRREYIEVQVYTDDVETTYKDRERVCLVKDNGARMTIHFDYDKWMERVDLEVGESREIIKPRETPREEIVVEPSETPHGEVVTEEPKGEEPGEERAQDLIDTTRDEPELSKGEQEMEDMLVVPEPSPTPEINIKGDTGS